MRHRLPPEAIFPAGRPEYRVRFVRVGTGVQLRAVETGPRTGPPVVLVHGWGASAYTFRHALPALASAGCRAIALDLPGHGLSDKPRDPATYRLDALAQSVLDGIDALACASVALVGHSMGATIAARTAARPGSPVERLVLLAPVGLGRVRDAAIGRLLTPAWAIPLLPLFAQRLAVVIALRFAFSTADGSRAVLAHASNDDIDQYWAPSRYPGYTAALRHLIHEFPWRLPDERWLREIACPALVIAGRGDRLVDPAGAAAFARAIPGADLQIIPGAGHAVAEQAPEVVDAAVVRFLTTPARRRPP
jgi:pimeloyl-ACP methyl ester carboxylesterase